MLTSYTFRLVCLHTLKRDNDGGESVAHTEMSLDLNAIPQRLLSRIADVRGATSFSAVYVNASRPSTRAVIRMEREASAGNMDEKVAPRRRAASVIPSLCSVASIAFCVVLSIHAADVRRRLAGLERGVDASTRAPADDLDALVAQKVNEMLSQVRSSRAHARFSSMKPR